MSEEYEAEDILADVDGNWHKIAAMILHKLDITKLELTVDDLESFPDDGYIMLHAQEEGMSILLVSKEEAEAMIESHTVANKLN